MFLTRTLKTTLIVASLALFSKASIAAIALDVNSLNANLGAGEYALGNVLTPGTFTDNWQFTLAQDSAVEVTLAQAVVPGFWEISDFEGNLLGDSGTSFMVPGLVAGDLYSLAVMGNVTGSFGGSYVGRFTVIEESAVVPVPAAAWLFGSALMGLVGIKRRRRPA